MTTKKPVEALAGPTGNTPTETSKKQKEYEMSLTTVEHEVASTEDDGLTIVCTCGEQISGPSPWKALFAASAHAAEASATEDDEVSTVLIEEDDGGKTIEIHEGDTTAWIDLEPGAAFWTCSVQPGGGVGHTIGTLQDYVDQARAMIHASTLMLRLNGLWPVA